MGTLTKTQEQILDEIPEKVQRYFELKAQMAELKKEMDEVKNELLADIDSLKVDNLEVNLGQDSRVKVAKIESVYEQLDKKALKEKFPEIYQEVKSEKKSSRLDIRKVKNKEND